MKYLMILITFLSLKSDLIDLTQYLLFVIELNQIHLLSNVQISKHHNGFNHNFINLLSFVPFIYLFYL